MVIKFVATSVARPAVFGMLLYIRFTNVTFEIKTHDHVIHFLYI